MDKERVKQALNEKYAWQYITPPMLIDIVVEVVADAIELSRQDDQVLISHPIVGSMIVCPSCNGKTCTLCDGGMVKVVSNEA